MNSIQRQHLLGTQQTQAKNTPTSTAKKIVGSFENMMNEVNNDQIQAEEKITQMVAGKNKDVAGTMIAMEKADVSMRMMMAVKNKAVNAYQEIMRMQI